ncbi:hypothetical protein I907_gp63 [Bacillus phage Eoghan]|uniref:Uncharacterized protein n=2 Tax=Andromedavirus TaxID=1623275 RepID=M1IES8_9CAUD|nr:hypothetical protein I907_gp63 [Bacillus phage Eoghan]YP_009592296.1 hypothetical protein FDG68_gp63 [Bacillus phage Taylor]AGE60827.1 hypothetical protein EOGHAN_64 [Bacillus phage Eoghan]AGE60981.1 hypothetical protein TAYLOR_63 [Bacillus phage Taylor]
MTNIKEVTIEEAKAVATGAIKKIDPINLEHILNEPAIEFQIEMMVKYAKQEKYDMVEYTLKDIEKIASEYNARRITPSNVQVGDGVTMHLHSDAHAGTVIKVTKTTVTVQRDQATLDPDFKPNHVAGGFAGHATNNDEQTYTYERNEKGDTITFRWSKKFNQYMHTQSGRKLSKGRKEFYDYNF